MRGLAKSTVPFLTLFAAFFMSSVTAQQQFGTWTVFAAPNPSPPLEAALSKYCEYTSYSYGGDKTFGVHVYPGTRLDWGPCTAGRVTTATSPRGEEEVITTDFPFPTPTGHMVVDHPNYMFSVNGPDMGRIESCSALSTITDDLASITQTLMACSLTRFGAQIVTRTVALTRTVTSEDTTKIIPFTTERRDIVTPVGTAWTALLAAQTTLVSAPPGPGYSATGIILSMIVPICMIIMAAILYVQKRRRSRRKAMDQAQKQELVWRTELQERQARELAELRIELQQHEFSKMLEEARRAERDNSTSHTASIGESSTGPSADLPAADSSELVQLRARIASLEATLEEPPPYQPLGA